MMRTRIYFVCFLIIFSILFGCSEKEIWKGKIEYIDGVKVVTNYNKGIWEENNKKVIFNEVASIETLGEDINKIFYQPMDVVADKGGDIYVLDSREGKIQKFDSHGNYLLTIGRKGQGPAEILYSEDIELDSQENILIFDQGNRRITKFDPQGNFIISYNLKFKPLFGVLDSKDNIYIYSQYNGKLIHKLNTQGQYYFSFLDEIKSEIKKMEPHLNGLGRIGIIKGNKVFLILTYPYTIYIYSTEGELLEKITTQVPYAQPPYITPDNAIPPNVVITTFFISGVDVSPDGYIFCRNVSVVLPKKLDSPKKIQEIMSSLFKEYSYTDIFNLEGHFLIHQKTKGFSWGGYFDKKGHYYGVEEVEDYFKIVKYSIQINR